MHSYRDRTGEVLFMDLRNMGTPYEKKYLELGDEERARITGVFHEWRSGDGEYENVPEFYYSATKQEIADKECWFYTDSTVRGGLSWDALCGIPLNLPSREDQQKIAAIAKLMSKCVASLTEQNNHLG